MPLLLIVGSIERLAVGSQFVVVAGRFAISIEDTLHEIVQYLLSQERINWPSTQGPGSSSTGGLLLASSVLLAWGGPGLGRRGRDCAAATLLRGGGLT